MLLLHTKSTAKYRCHSFLLSIWLILIMIILLRFFVLIFVLFCLFVCFFSVAGVGWRWLNNPMGTRYQYVLYVGQINSFARKVFC